MCYFKEYPFPSDVKSMQDRRKYVCTQMIDPEVIDIDTINSCMIPDFFCDVCCNSNIGPGQEVQREQCSQKCSQGLVAGDTNSFTVSYVLEINKAKFDKEKEAMRKVTVYQLLIEIRRRSKEEGCRILEKDEGWKMIVIFLINVIDNYQRIRVIIELLMKLISSRPLTNHEAYTLIQKQQMNQLEQQQQQRMGQIAGYLENSRYEDIQEIEMILKKLNQFPLSQSEKIQLINLKPKEMIDVHLVSGIKNGRY